MSEDNRIDNLREELGEETPVEETPATPEAEEETPEEETPPAEEEETPEGEEEEEEDDPSIPEKFKGKSVKEVIASYQELETLIGQRTLEKTERKDLKDAGMGRKDLTKMDDLKNLVEGTDFSKMDAKQFAEWLVGITDSRAESRAREIYQTASTVQQAVRTEIQEATDQFPLLKSNKEFRELVLAVIEADAGRGEVTPIIEASKKVSAMMGAQKKTEEKEKNVKARKRTAVETKRGGAGDAPDTEEEAVKKGIIRGGGNSSSPMGGLGL